MRTRAGRAMGMPRRTPWGRGPISLPARSAPPYSVTACAVRDARDRSGQQRRRVEGRVRHDVEPDHGHQRQTRQHQQEEVVGGSLVAEGERGRERRGSGRPRRRSRRTSRGRSCRSAGWQPAIEVAQRVPHRVRVEQAERAGDRRHQPGRECGAEPRHPSSCSLIAPPPPTSTNGHGRSSSSPAASQTKRTQVALRRGEEPHRREPDERARASASHRLPMYMTSVTR